MSGFFWHVPGLIIGLAIFGNNPHKQKVSTESGTGLKNGEEVKIICVEWDTSMQLRFIMENAK